MTRRDLLLIDAAAFLRSFGIGLLGVVLGVYLYRAGLTSTQIGLVVGAGLAGAAAALTLISSRGAALPRRRLLIGVALVVALGGVGLAFTTDVPLLLLVSFLTMLNGMGTDRTVAYALEQAIIPDVVSGRDRTSALSRYNLVLDVGHALGALSAGVPLVVQHWTGMELLAAYRLVFLGYAGINVASVAAYAMLTTRVEREADALPAVTSRNVSQETRRITRRLSSLFAIDAFGGGFLTDAIISYWFFRRFGVAEHGLGLLFFVVHILNASSYLGAAWLARRIGLLKTMVFTHLPSSVLLIAVPFAPSFGFAAALFLLREALVEMDVPTRQSYLAAVVQPRERVYASGVTNVTRNVSWAAASAVTGLLMQTLGLSAPLVAGGGLKIGYDLLLYGAFRSVRPPEEQQAPVGAG